MYKTMIFLVLFFFSSVGLAKPLTLEEVAEAAVKVSVSRASGSGTVVHEDQNNYYVLTNAHVVGQESSGSVEFFNNGYKSGKIPMQVVKKFYSENSDVDFAILSVSKSSMGSYKPRIIRINPAQLQGNEYFVSGGCPGARWLQLFEGHLLENKSSRLIFTPPPESGRSGSSVVCNINGESYVVGVITWSIGGSGFDSNGNPLSKGGAIPMTTLASVIQQRYIPQKMPANYEYIAQKICLFARGSDGKLYHQRERNGRQEVERPNNVAIIQWNVPDS